MSLDLSANASTASEIAAARQADVVAFLHRAPFTLDADKLGFLPGFREDCGYQQTQYQDLNIPVGMLDNDFRKPDLDRFVDRFFEHEPQVGVIGDVYERDDVDAHVAAAREIQGSYPEAELITVPKCRAVIDTIPDDLLLDAQADDPDAVTDERIRDEVFTFVLPGHETTALTLTYAPYLLSQSPGHAATVVDEVTAVDPDGVVRFGDLSELTATERTPKEAMRLSPPVYAAFRDRSRTT